MNFLELVKTAYFVSDNAARRHAEEQLLDMLFKQPDAFFRDASLNFVSSSDPVLVQANGSLLKSGIQSRDTLSNFNWLKLQESTVQFVKEKLLSQLINCNLLIKKSSANCISAICAIELPLKKWPDIV